MPQPTFPLLFFTSHVQRFLPAWAVDGDMWQPPGANSALPSGAGADYHGFAGRQLASKAQAWCYRMSNCIFFSCLACQLILNSARRREKSVGILPAFAYYPLKRTSPSCFGKSAWRHEDCRIFAESRCHPKGPPAASVVAHRGST